MISMFLFRFLMHYTL